MPTSPMLLLERRLPPPPHQLSRFKTTGGHVLYGIEPCINVVGVNAISNQPNEGHCFVIKVNRFIYGYWTWTQVSVFVQRLPSVLIT